MIFHNKSYRRTKNIKFVQITSSFFISTIFKTPFCPPKRFFIYAVNKAQNIGYHFSKKHIVHFSIIPDFPRSVTDLE